MNLAYKEIFGTRDIGANLWLIIVKSLQTKNVYRVKLKQIELCMSLDSVGHGMAAICVVL